LYLRIFFLLATRTPTTSSLFPYTTLFRSPPHTTYEVGRAKIAEFADAIGDDNPLHRDVEAAKEAGYPDVIAPPTFLTIINIRARSEEHTSELQSREKLVCRLLLEKKKKIE